MAIRYHKVFGSKEQLTEIRNLIKNFKISVVVLDKGVIREGILLYEEWELEGNIKELDRYFISFKNHGNTILRFIKGGI